MRDAAHNHILLALAAVAAGQIALHHILVEAVECYSHKYAGQKLFPKVGAGQGVVKIEHLERRMRGDGAESFTEIQPKVSGYEVYAQPHRCHQAEALERVGPNQSLDAALHGVYPYQ